MRFLLFYGLVGSLNHFSNELSREFERMGIETKILDLNSSNADYELFLREKFDAAVCYNSIGTFTAGNSELMGIYDELDIPVINILMDHPMNLSYCMKQHPAKYIQFSPDEEHVKYAKKYYDLENCFFLPHMASEIQRREEIDKDIEVLFPAALVQCNELYKKIQDTFQSNSFMLKVVLDLLEFLIANPQYTMEAALEVCLKNIGVELSLKQFAVMMSGIKDADLFIRMYFREKVILELSKTGRPIVVVGRGWDASSAIKQSNIKWLPSISFSDVFSYMERSKVTLTVMPWFKAGTHDRIFNSLLHNSCPLTDESRWLTAHLAPNQECAYFSLDSLANIGNTLEELLGSEDVRKTIIENGRKKVEENYTSRNIAQQIVSYLEQCYG